MSHNLFINKLKQWGSTSIGITINCQDKVDEDIISIFEHISIILGIMK